MKRMELWKKILNEMGYKIIWDKFLYWEVPFAVNDATKEKIPLAVVYDTEPSGSTVATIAQIRASTKNFDAIKFIHSEEYKDKPCGYSVLWKDKKSCDIKL